MGALGAREGEARFGVCIDDEWRAILDTIVLSPVLEICSRFCICICLCCALFLSMLFDTSNQVVTAYTLRSREITLDGRDDSLNTFVSSAARVTTMIMHAQSASASPIPATA